MHGMNDDVTIFRKEWLNSQQVFQQSRTESILQSPLVYEHYKHYIKIITIIIITTTINITIIISGKFEQEN